MNYQGEVGTVAGVSTTVAGIAVLPNTGGSSILLYVGIAAIVTGVTLVTTQVAVWFYRRSR
jgi:hypothetical protein